MRPIQAIKSPEIRAEIELTLGKRAERMAANIGMLSIQPREGAEENSVPCVCKVLVAKCSVLGECLVEHIDLKRE
ncbi:hypothetical protein GCM10027398_25600 [Azotobacter salinestris]